MSSRGRQWPGFALSGSGLIVSTYLLLRTFALLAQEEASTGDVCSTVFGVGCDAALMSPASWLFGIPLAGWGGVYYGALLAILLLGLLLEEIRRETVVGALIVAVIGALCSVILVVLVALDRAAFCPLCFVVHAINIALVPILAHDSDLGVRQVTASIRAGVSYVLTGRSSAPSRSRWTSLTFLTAGLVAVVLYQWVLIQAERRRGLPPRPLDREQVLAAYDAAPLVDIHVDADDPVMGPIDAPVRIVVFSDFQCPFCQAFADDMYHLSDHFPEQVAVVFKHYPLDASCNPALDQRVHPESCPAALAAEAARLQGAFWEYHDKLFAMNLDANPDAFTTAARNSGLDMERFERDRKSAAVVTKVQTDIEEGTRVGVNGTPTVFLNGRKLGTTSLQVLELLARKELGSTP